MSYWFWWCPFLLPLLLQIGLKFSPQLAGLLLAPTALGVLFVKPLAFYILRLLGYKKLLIINTLLVGIVLFLLGLVTMHTPVVLIAFLTFIYGLLISLQYSGMNSLAYANIESDDLSAATSIMSTIQQLSQSFGVAIAAIIIKLFSTHFHDFMHLTVAIFHYAFWTMGILTLLSVFIFQGLETEDGRELIEVPTKL